MVVLVGLSVFPFLYLLRSAFYSFQMLSPIPPRPTGFANFVHLFHDPLFYHSLAVTAAFAADVVTVQLAAAIAVALLVFHLPRFQQAIVTLLLMPTIISPSVAAFQWVQLYNYQFGPLNFLLRLLHLPTPVWTGSEKTALWSVVLVDFWEWTPFMVLLIYAGLQSLPRSLFEAAAVDGSSFWQTLVNITLPLLRPTVVVTVILRLIATFKLFDIVYVLTAGGPGIATETLSFFTYTQAFKYFNIGYASAIGIVQLVLVTLLARLLLRLMGTARASTEVGMARAG